MTHRRDELIDLAELILERDGLESFGVNSLAREAGIKPPSLYKHFVGISEIEHALIARWLRRLAKVVSRGDRRSIGGQRVAGFISVYRRFSAESPELYKLATSRRLDRNMLVNVDPGCDAAALKAIAGFLNEPAERPSRARLVWAAAHGMISLVNAGLLAEGAELDAAWELMTEMPH